MIERASSITSLAAVDGERKEGCSLPSNRYRENGGHANNCINTIDRPFMKVVFAFLFITGLELIFRLEQFFTRP